MKNNLNNLQKLIFTVIIFFGFFGLAPYQSATGQAQSSEAATIYVDNTTTGCSTPSDTNYDPVTETCGAGAYKVYDKLYLATQAVAAGDTIIVQDGTYGDRYTWTSGMYVVGAIKGSTGTAENPITIKAANKYGAKITCGTLGDGDGGLPAGNYRGFFLNTNISYVSIEDFEIYTCTHGFSINANNDHITFKGNKIHDTYTAVTVGNDCDYAMMDSNIVYDFGDSSNQNHGLYGRGINGTMVNNLIYGNRGGGWSIHIGSYGTQPSGIWKIINNTLVGTSSSNACVTFYGSDAITTLYLHNNICFGATSGLVYNLGTWKPGWEAKNNIVANSNTICYPGQYGVCTNCDSTRCADNLTNQDPEFINSTRYDFHLLGSSPAIDAGLATYAPAYDILNISRDANPDIGAYEYVSGGDTTPPASPTGLTVL